MEEKCFCHLNGYKVKDSDARKSIENLLNEINTLSENTNNSINNLETTINENLGKELRKNHIWIFNPYSLSIYFGTNSVITKSGASDLEQLNKIWDEMKEDSKNGNISKILIVNTNSGTLIFNHSGVLTNSTTTFYCTGIISGMGEFVGTSMGLVQDSDKKITSFTFSKTASYLTPSNTQSYTVYNDYNPAHKKYVDEKIATALANNTGGTSVAIDDTPTSGSNNAVSSGGVKSYVDGKLGDLEGVPVKTYLDGLEDDILLAHNMVNTFTNTNMRSLIWENKDNTTSLNQTSINFTPYYNENNEIIPITHIEVIYLNGTNQALFSTGLIPLVNDVKTLRLEGITSNKLSYREITLNTDLLGASINNGRLVDTYGTNNTSGYSDNTGVCIPVRIYATYSEIPSL